MKRWNLGLAAVLYDLESPILLEADLRRSELLDMARRHSRTQLLSGGVYINDTGYSAGDRTLDITLGEPTQAQEDFLVYLLQSHPEILIATRDGAFTGAITGLKSRGGVLKFSLLLAEQVS